MRARPHSLLGISFVGVLAFLSSARSQYFNPDSLDMPENWIDVQDGVVVYKRAGNGYTLDPGEIISAAYRFEMIYDSTSRVQYTVSECLHNGARLRLLAWKDGHVHTARPEMMADSSRTESFRVVAGDTVSAFRQWEWYDPKEHRQDTTNFRSLDTLDYVIELVSVKTNDRIALLDSFGVLPRDTPGPPTFYGSRPIMATARYIIPSTASPDTAFIRIRLYLRGDGLYLPIREDAITYGTSYAVEHGFLNWYLNLYSGSLGKRSVDELSHTNGSLRSPLVVSYGSDRTVQIRFSVPPGNGPVELVIYDVAGNPLFVPYNSPSAAEEETATYSFLRSGTYFVALLRAGVLLGAEKIIITR
jgi:hypothetical protein